MLLLYLFEDILLPIWGVFYLGVHKYWKPSAPPSGDAYVRERGELAEILILERTL